MLKLVASSSLLKCTETCGEKIAEKAAQAANLLWFMCVCYISCIYILYSTYIKWRLSVFIFEHLLLLLLSCPLAY